MSKAALLKLVLTMFCCVGARGGASWDQGLAIFTVQSLIQIIQFGHANVDMFNTTLGTHCKFQQSYQQ